MWTRPADFADRQLTCSRCGDPFTWTAQQQANAEIAVEILPPKKCPACRDVYLKGTAPRPPQSAEARTVVCTGCGAVEVYESGVPASELFCVSCRRVVHRARQLWKRRR